MRSAERASQPSRTWQGLPYLDACWTESLRLYGPGVSILREAATDQRIGGHFIPKGTALQVSCTARTAACRPSAPDWRSRVLGLGWRVRSRRQRAHRRPPRPKPNAACVLLACYNCLTPKAFTLQERVVVLAAVPPCSGRMA